MSEPKVTNDDSHDFELWEDFRNGNEKAFLRFSTGMFKCYSGTA